ncbi:C-type lectin domain family 11 member A [Elysia marginata]|uniref:C-type lectin domain family 11 member A n=1 Tax=Elysia marginata TaxID=1093978 RepID=A0AAV4JID7_9GAST|nr:C-type lectin domain family 11 member A [Elysia marginata]
MFLFAVTVTVPLLVQSVLGAKVTVLNSCPSDAVKVVGSDHFQVMNDTCYLFLTYEEVTYDAAKAKCQANGGNLAMPKTKDANEFLLQGMNSLKQLKPMWIGMHDKIEEGTMVWEDGTEVDDWGNYDWANSGWFGEGEDCVALDPKDRKWHDYGCLQTGLLNKIGVSRNAKLPFICEYPIQKDGADSDATVKKDKADDDAAVKKDKADDDATVKEDLDSEDNTNIVLEDQCPPFNCPDLDCGMDGYKTKNNCQLCECA